jgi:hypothetical protein
MPLRKSYPPDRDSNGYERSCRPWRLLSPLHLEVCTQSFSDSEAGASVRQLVCGLNLNRQVPTNYADCLEEHEKQFSEITNLVFSTMTRLDLDDDEIRRRVESDEYQGLVRRAFRDRSTYDTDAKTEHLRKLLANAAFPGVVPDDLIRLFIDWLSRYNDLHFRVMATLRSTPLSTRADIWDLMHGESVREDSAEADLFAYLITELSLGHVIRQEREKTSDGQFLKARPKRTRARSPYMKSRFDDEKSYELTELGNRFIHYVMDEVVKKLTR